MVLLFGHVNVLLTISFILLELGLTPLRENSCYVAFKLSCHNFLNYTSTVDCCTDAEKPEQNGDDSSSSSDGLSPYSSQLLLTMFLDAPRFRNLSLKKDLCPAAKALNVKVRGLGKYELANKLAKSLIEKGFVTVSGGANGNCLKREEIKVLKTLGEHNVIDVTVANESSSVGTPISASSLDSDSAESDMD